MVNNRYQPAHKIQYKYLYLLSIKYINNIIDIYLYGFA